MVIPRKRVGSPRVTHPCATNFAGNKFLAPFVRLACIRHAASVRPEPGSNSHESSWVSWLLIFCWLFFILLVCSVSNLFRLNWSDFSIRTLTHFGVCLYSVFNELSLSSQVTTSTYYHAIVSLSNIFYNFFNVFFFRSDVLYRTSVNIAWIHSACQHFFKLFLRLIFLL